MHLASLHPQACGHVQRAWCPLWLAQRRLCRLVTLPLEMVLAPALLSVDAAALQRRLHHLLLTRARQRARLHCWDELGPLQHPALCRYHMTVHEAPFPL